MSDGAADVFRYSKRAEDIVYFSIDFRAACNLETPRVFVIFVAEKILFCLCGEVATVKVVHKDQLDEPIDAEMLKDIPYTHTERTTDNFRQTTHVYQFAGSKT